MEMTIDKLIEILERAKNEIGGDTVIKLYDDFSSSCDFDDDYIRDICSIQVKGVKSYFGQSVNNEDKALYIKYEWITN